MQLGLQSLEEEAVLEDLQLMVVAEDHRGVMGSGELAPLTLLRTSVICCESAPPVEVVVGVHGL